MSEDAKGAARLQGQRISEEARRSKKKGACYCAAALRAAWAWVGRW